MSNENLFTSLSVARLNFNTHDVQMSYFDREGRKLPILFVHGLGNASDNFLDLLEEPALADHRLIAMDLPGSGASPYSEDDRLQIDDLVSAVDAFVERIRLRDFLLVGASMGGLIALLYAEKHHARLRGFVNVEGNLTSEDCLFSRLVVGHEYPQFEELVFPEIKESLRRRHGRGFAKHVEVLEGASSLAYYDYSFQTVRYSDEGGLLQRFLNLPIPQCFVYGSANRHLSYLPRLRQSPCTVIEIADADHFLFYDNPRAFAVALAQIAREV